MVEQLNRDVSQLQSSLNNLESEIKSLQEVIEGTVSKAIEDTISKTIDPNTLKAFRYLIYKMVCDSIKELIARGTALSLDEVKSILTEWGLDLNNQEVGKRIESSIPPWTEEKHAIVPLKNVTYGDSDIVVTLNGERVSIRASLLPFETGTVLEEIKDIFEGNLEVFIEKALSFQWESNQLEIKKEEYRLKQEISVDSSSLQIFKKIKELKDKLGPFKAKLVISELAKESKTQVAEDTSGIPPSLLSIDPDYNPDCVDVLMGMAMKDVCYFTAIDLWFKIDDFLIWEEPRYGKATYIFNWPEEPLQVFILRIRLSKLKDIRGDPKSGYIGKVPHYTKEDTSNWERNLRKYMYS